jgi:hypothetical protein
LPIYLVDSIVKRENLAQAWTVPLSS